MKNAKKVNEIISKLPESYLRTKNDTVCVKCGVLGAHYLMDNQPMLYLYNHEWWCRMCIARSIVE